LVISNKDTLHQNGEVQTFCMEHNKEARTEAKRAEESVTEKIVEQGWRTFRRARTQTVYNFRKKNHSHAHGNVEEENTVLEPSITIIN
jgi:hypothetical protein